jgi:hypothetical protein
LPQWKTKSVGFDALTHIHFHEGQINTAKHPSKQFSLHASDSWWAKNIVIIFGYHKDLLGDDYHAFKGAVGNSRQPSA